MTELRNSIGKKPTVIFLHIPKAAGSTLHRQIQPHYEPAAVLAIEGSCIRECMAEFDKLAAARKSQIRFVRGHMPFGLHRAIPGPCIYVTCLRDPVDRIISRYYYTLRRPDNYLYDTIASQKMGLKEFVSSGISTELDNDQTRRLSGVGRTVPFGQCTAELLERAKKNIREHFAVVGLSERFDETLLLINGAFGWRSRCYVKTNVTRNRPHIGAIAKDTRNLIAENNQLDIELYRYAAGLFEQLIRQQGRFFEQKLKAFKLANWLYAKLHMLALSARHRTMALRGIRQLPGYAGSPEADRGHPGS
ncbi:MAG: sulfotransferase family 2 domain-containing protein [bacterium]